MGQKETKDLCFVCVWMREADRKNRVREEAGLATCQIDDHEQAETIQYSLPLAVVCSVVRPVLSLRVWHCDSLFVWLVLLGPSQLPAGSWLHLSSFKLGKSAETGSTKNLNKESCQCRTFIDVYIISILRFGWPNAYRLSAVRMVNRCPLLLLLLLQFSSASFLPIISLAEFFSSEPKEIFRLLTWSAGFRIPAEASVTCGAAWKNFCRAAWVFWAEAVQDWDCGLGFKAFRTVSAGADSTEEKRGACCFWVAPVGCKAPLLTSASKEDILEPFWWELQKNVSGFFPGLYPPA